MTRVRVLRVFTDDAGERGNALGVVRDAGGIARARRRAIASELGYSETVFVEERSADSDLHARPPSFASPGTPRWVARGCFAHRCCILRPAR